MPCRLTFRTRNGGKYVTLFKHGDDLRQDQLILQMIELMDKVGLTIILAPTFFWKNFSDSDPFLNTNYNVLLKREDTKQQNNKSKVNAKSHLIFSRL
jgi:hypothetical protein